MELSLVLLIPVAFIVIAILVVRWALKWNDPSLSSKEKQAEAELWSTKNTNV